MPEVSNKTNLEDGINHRGSLDKALHVLRFTIHSEKQKQLLNSNLDENPEQD